MTKNKQLKPHPTVCKSCLDAYFNNADTCLKNINNDPNDLINQVTAAFSSLIRAGKERAYRALLEKRPMPCLIKIAGQNIMPNENTLVPSWCKYRLELTLINQKAIKPC